MSSLDAERVEQFAGKMLGALNGGALALMASIGHRTGLFDVMSRMRPATSSQVAVAAGLDERYVREWLAAMVTGGVIEYSPGDETYSLPREHAAVLTRASRPDNIAASCQWIAVLGSVEDRVLECFERGGGVPRAAYARFHAVAAEDEQSVVAELVEHIVPLAPGLPESLARGIDVLDVGCGAGSALNRLAAAFPLSRFTGYDAAPEAIAAARSVARELHLANVRYEIRDPAKLGHTDDFDCVLLLGMIHEQQRPEAVLAGIAQSLRPDGVVLIRDVSGTSHLEEDVAHPLAPFLYAISCLHCMTVSLASGGQGLGAMWGSERALRMLCGAGLGRVAIERLPHDSATVYFVAHK